MKVISEVWIKKNKRPSEYFTRITKNKYLKSYHRFANTGKDCCRRCGKIFSASQSELDCDCNTLGEIYTLQEMTRVMKECQIVEIKKEDYSKQFEVVLRQKKANFIKNMNMGRNTLIIKNKLYELSGYIDHVGEGTISVKSINQDLPPSPKNILLKNEIYFFQVSGKENEWDFSAERYITGTIKSTGEECMYLGLDYVFTFEKAKHLAEWAHQTLLKQQN